MYCCQNPIGRDNAFDFSLVDLALEAGGVNYGVESFSRHDDKYSSRHQRGDPSHVAAGKYLAKDVSRRSRLMCDNVLPEKEGRREKYSHYYVSYRQSHQQVIHWGLHGTVLSDHKDNQSVADDVEAEKQEEHGGKYDLSIHVVLVGLLPTLLNTTPVYHLHLSGLYGLMSYTVLIRIGWDEIRLTLNTCLSSEVTFPRMLESRE